MKSRNPFFKLSLQKSTIAKVSHSTRILGGAEDKTTDDKTVDSFPKTLPMKQNDLCQSTDPFVC